LPLYACKLHSATCMKKSKIDFLHQNHTSNGMGKFIQPIERMQKRPSWMGGFTDPIRMMRSNPHPGIPDNFLKRRGEPVPIRKVYPIWKVAILKGIPQKRHNQKVYPVSGVNGDIQVR